MINWIKNLFGGGPVIDFKALLKSGAQIIDVRTKSEFQNGHIRGAVNIPLNTLAGHAAKLRKDQPVITCCASGVRSAQAKHILSDAGFTQVYNGGGWKHLQQKLQ